MGSTAMMEETTRHRRPTKQSLMQVPSGDSQDNDDHHNTKTTRRRRRRSRKDEPSFAVLVCQVGMTLLIICSVLFFMYRRVCPYDPHAGMIDAIVYIVDDDQETPNNDHNIITQKNDNRHQQQKDYTAEDEARLAMMMKQQQKDKAVVASKSPETPPPPPLPHFELSQAAIWDAFGMAGQSNLTNTTTSNVRTFSQAAKGLRERFAETYGTENIARMLLDKGMTTFFEGGSTSETAPPADIISTACRLQQVQQEKRPFRVAFGGYSVTAGRGNTFEQSFPFQFQRLAETVFKLAGISGLQVTNAAIGGCSAFPYGWCMTNFWGAEPDVVSWDYSMNEAGGVPEGLEAYIRHVLSTYNSAERMTPPKLIVKDTYLAAQRRDVLGAYASRLLDPIVIHTGPAVKPILDRKEEHRPAGFQDWRKFGAPLGAPGQALHHPALKEHEMIGWMLTMHFLTALEYLMAHQTDGEGGSGLLSCPPLEHSSTLPPPVSGIITNTNTTITIYEGLLFGHPSPLHKDVWTMNPVRCRTTFQPIISGDLSEVVVSGTTGEDLDAALPKSQMYYNQGWTLDLSEGEKTAKRKLSVYENELGFVDLKEAYYGIYESPSMQLLLPYEWPSGDALLRVGQRASDWFRSIVVCQVNEKRDSKACNMGSDMGFVVGGVNAANSTHMMKGMGTLYLGKQVCVQIQIPTNATLTSHNELTSSKDNKLENDQVGILVEISVTNPHIAHVNQACSVSHVVWEEMKRDSATTTSNILLK